jgi:hypothetical protein
MIRMPRRSVTRFFIPLLDVLLLLFCIFLLMPMSTEESQGTDSASRDRVEDLLQRITSLERELESRTVELRRFEQLGPELQDVARLQEELERLRKEKINTLQKRLVIRLLEIDGKTGELSYFDPANNDQPVIKLQNEEAARGLIARLKKEAGEREEYYQFYLPRNSGYPTRKDTEKFQRWFEPVAHSLQKKEK